MPSGRICLARRKVASAALTLLVLALLVLVGAGPMHSKTNSPLTSRLTRYNPVLDRADYPAGIAITPDGRTLYVTAAKSHNVIVIDIASGQILEVIDPTQGGTVDVVVEKIAITPDGQWAVINNPVTRPEFSGSVSLVSLPDNADTGHPRLVNTLYFPNSSTDQPLVSPDSRTAYVPGNWPPRIFAVDIRSGTVTASVDLSLPAINLWTHVIALSPDGCTLYAVGPYGLPDGSPSGYSRLVSVDTATFMVSQVVDLPIAGAVNFGQAAVSPDGTELYLVWGENNQVIALDLLDGGTVLAEIDFAQETWCLQAIAFRPDGRRAYVGGGAPGGIFVVDADTYTVLEHVLPGEHGFSDMHALVAAPGGGALYVTGADADAVFCLDTATHDLDTFVELNPIHLWPMQLALSGDGRWLYVDGIEQREGTPGGVHVVDTEALAVSERIPLRSSLIQGGSLTSFHGLALSPDGERLYVHAHARSQSNPDHRLSLALDLSTKQVVGAIDLGPIQTDVGDKVAVSPDGSRVYTSLTAERRLLVASTDTLEVVAEIPLGIEPIDIAINQDGTRATVSGAEPVSHSVSRLAVVDLVANTVMTTVVGTTDYPPPCPGLGLAPGEDEAWLGSNNRIEIMDIAAMTIAQDIDLGALMTAGDLGPACPYGITFSPDGEQVYVANYDANNLMIFDATSRALQHKVNVGFSPTEVIVSPDGSRAYVLNSESESVSVIDTDSGEVVATIPLVAAWRVYLPAVLR
jgi:YVTN family beta-propeller protein